MIESNRIQTLREQLYREPSVHLWCELWRSFGAIRATEDVQAAIAYAQEHLSTWPQAMRSIRLYCNETLLQTQPSVCLDWAEHVELVLDEAHPELFIDWCKSDWCRACTSLSLKMETFPSAFEWNEACAEAFLASPASQSLRHFKMAWVSCEPAALMRLLWDSRWTSLERLELISCGEEESLKALIYLAHFQNVQHLNLNFNHLGDTFFQSILSSSTLKNIRSLLFHGNALEGNQLTDPSWRGAGSPLDTLFIGSNPGTARVVSFLTEHSRCSALQKLDVRNASLTPFEVDTFLSAHWMSSLKHLGLSGGLSGPESAERLSLAHPKTMLNYLDLSNCRNAIHSSTFEAIIHNPWLSQLQSLSLIRSISDVDTWRHLATSPCLETLRTLYISENTFDPHSMKQLFSSESWGQQLRRLDASLDLSTHLQSTASRWLTELIRSPALAALTHLELRYVYLLDSLLEEMKRSECWPELQLLDLSHSVFSSEEGLSVLLKTKAVESLSTFKIHGSTQTLSQLEKICNHPALRYLTSFSFGHEQIGTPAIQSILQGRSMQHLHTLRCTLDSNEHAEAQRMLCAVREPVYMSNTVIERDVDFM